ncbi:MAG: tRNA lysidine(34) synthetase TilS [Limisphaerales bacterium]
MTGLLKHVELSIQNRRLLRRGDRVLVAVSGGLDSMALLHVLHQVATRHRWRLTVAHFNHRLRGCASNADENLVRRAAAALKLPFVAGRADVKDFARQSKLSVEMAARKLRHEFLARTARQRKISVIALAQHADDQVELFFLRLLRGAGGEGLAGMKWRSASPADARVALVRLLLDCGKDELRAFARENKIRFRDDATNSCTDLLRNRIRHELLPLLRKKYQPALNQTVLRLMEIVGAESELVGAMAESFCRRRGDESQIKSGNRESEEKLETPYVVSYGFNELPPALQRKALHQQLIQLGLAVDFELVEKLRETPGRPVSVGAGLSVVRDTAGTLKLQTQSPDNFNTGQLAAVLAGRAGEIVFDGRKFRWAVKPFNNTRGSAFARLRRDKRSPRQTEFFDADKVGNSITLRHWHPGDRFQPISLKSPVKLQDLFTNAKIPRTRRRELAVAVVGSGEIFWVEGLRIGEIFKLTPGTKRCLVWRWQHSEVPSSHRFEKRRPG